MSEDDIHERTTIEPPPPEEPPLGDLHVLKSQPVGKRTGFDNLVLEVASLTAHVSELRDLLIRVESSVQTMTATFHTLEATVKFTAEQMGESVSRASEEVLRSRQAVIEFVPRLQQLEHRTDVLEQRRKVGNGDGA
jgi:hypothetical protein